ncbi:MAG: hypothetical protein H6656_06035 [Ardenticatenaceae bacterium]|nr:hypothetical protein [Anaerolineales bacterium]MCB9006911.1 hypothetical protein [Ardenticatenaceae bacterium]
MNAFETPRVDLVGKITAAVHEHGGVAPTTIIKAGTPWSVHIKWEMKGTNWHMVAGNWHVHVNLESIGPGPELSLYDYADPNCQNQPLPSPTGEYSCHFDVPGSVLSTSVVPHQGLAMKLVVLLTYVDPLGHRGPIAGYWEGPILQFYEDHP